VIQPQITQIQDEIEQTDRDYRTLLSERTWWQKHFLCNWRDWIPPEPERKNRERYLELKSNLSELERTLQRLSYSAAAKKEIRKEYRNALKNKEYRERCKEFVAQREKAFADTSLIQIGLPDYTREKFLI